MVPDYASVKDIEEIRKDFMKMNRHSTIPEVSTFTENVVMRTGSKDTPRNVKSADEFTISELMASAGDAAAKKRMDNRRSPQRRIPEIRTSGEFRFLKLQCAYVIQVASPPPPPPRLASF